MNRWRLLERNTQLMRAEPGCPPDACVYGRRDDLRAFVFCEAPFTEWTGWHLVVQRPERMPSNEDCQDAKQALLPNVPDMVAEPVPDLGYAWHMFEIPREKLRGHFMRLEARRTLQ
jgi:hypothetical protein